MKIAYVTTFDPGRPESWPRRHLGLYGASVKIAQTLRDEGAEVQFWDGLVRRKSPVSKLKWLFYRHVRQENFYGRAGEGVSRAYARQMRRKLVGSDADILLCPENAIPIAAYEPERPMVLWTDAPLGSLIDFYPYLSDLCKESRRTILRMEKRALSRCERVILTSQWAVDRTHALYGTPWEKMRIVPRGSNQVSALSVDEVRRAIDSRGVSRCHLLFVGVEWKRKGGDEAVAIAREVQRKGLDVTLHVVGCRPQGALPEFVKVHGFVDRSTPEGSAKMSQMFLAANFFVFMTKADTFGISVSEAASYGVPAVASAVGGVPSAVKQDVSGQVFTPGTEAGAIADYIVCQMSDGATYRALAHSTFEHYQQALSWEAIGGKAKAVLDELMV